MNKLSSNPYRSADLKFQNRALEGVSRTFALTIPQLPTGLLEVVGNAYLLCRIADTIEDEPALSLNQKRHFSERFIKVVAGEEDAGQFASQLLPHLTQSTTTAERKLIQHTQKVIRITHASSSVQRRAMERCIRIMTRGMSHFQTNASLSGLADLAQLDQYCYCVAGVVGEMLTDLFCDHCPEMAKKHEQLFKLAVSFGQALQMTNILKDVWDDQARGVCWFPREIFDRAGFDLDNLSKDHDSEGYINGLHQLVKITHDHQVNALRYVLYIPYHQPGIRRHCLWALGMSILTLDKIYKKPTFSSGKEVKISRLTVKSVISQAQSALDSNRALTEMFNRLSSGFRSFSENQELPTN